MSKAQQQLCLEWRQGHFLRHRKTRLALPNASCLKIRGSCCRTAEGAPATTCPRYTRMAAALSNGSDRRRRIMAVRTPHFPPCAPLVPLPAAHASYQAARPEHRTPPPAPPPINLPGALAWPPAFGVGPNLSRTLTLARRAAARHMPVPVQVSSMHEDVWSSWLITASTL